MKICLSLEFYRTNPESLIEESPSRIVLSETSWLLEQKYWQHININRGCPKK